MYDLSMPNDKPGTCCKCRGTGVYRWGTITNGVAAKSGPCFSCKGTGKQSRRQIKTNHAYNRHKIVEIFRADTRRALDRDAETHGWPLVRDPGEDAADRWNESHGDRY